MAGLPVEFFNWKKMPKRDKERVPMVCYSLVILDGARIFKNASDCQSWYDTSKYSNDPT